MINIVTSVVGEVADRVSEVQGDLDMVGAVSSQSFDHAPGIQAVHDTLVEEIRRWRDEAEGQVSSLAAAVDIIQQAFIEADQAMAAVWDPYL